MSSSSDDHIRSVLDRLRVTLSGQLEAELTASAADIVRVVSEEHRQALVDATERTASEVRLAAEQQLSSAREEFDRQREEHERDKKGLQHDNDVLQREKEDLDRANEDARLGAASEIAGLERALNDAREQLDFIRRNLDQTESAGETLRLQLEQSRRDHESATRELQESRRDHESATRELQESRRDHESATRELQETIERTSREAQQTRLEMDSTAQELQRVRARLAQTLRLTSALRTLDDAASLGEILDQLAQSASQESARTAVFLVNGKKLRGWRALGFQDGNPIVGSEFEPADAGVIEHAVRMGVSQQHRNGDSERLPSFAEATGPRDAIAVPVQVGGSVIAVLYADAARADSSEDPEWLETIDALTKHAGRVLEAMTVRQAAALWTPRHAARR